MTNTDFSTRANEWVTLTDDTASYLLSDGSGVEIRLTPAGWIVEHDGVQICDDLLPYRAGAMEWVRRWLTKSELTTVPTPAQAAQPWHDPNWQDRTKPRRQPPATPAPAPAIDPLAFARELEAMRLAHELNAMLNPK